MLTRFLNLFKRGEKVDSLSRTAGVLTAEERLATMTPIAEPPPLDQRRKSGPNLSAPCVLAYRRDDGSLLEYGEFAVFHFARGVWVSFPKCEAEFTAPITHYQIIA